MEKSYAMIKKENAINIMILTLNFLPFIYYFSNFYSFVLVILIPNALAFLQLWSYD